MPSNWMFQEVYKGVSAAEDKNELNLGGSYLDK